MVAVGQVQGYPASSHKLPAKDRESALGGMYGEPFQLFVAMTQGPGVHTEDTQGREAWPVAESTLGTSQGPSVNMIVPDSLYDTAGMRC